MNPRRHLLLSTAKLFYLGLLGLSFGLATAMVVSQGHGTPTLRQFLSMRIKLENFVLFGFIVLAWHIVLSTCGFYESTRLAPMRALLLETAKATTAAAVVDALGGGTEAANMVGCTPQNICNAVRRGRLPPSTFLIFTDELARRGVSTLMVDQPGVGEALRLKGLTAVVDTERWASACLDVLEKRSDVDRNYLGICAWSLGGYFAPRAAAFEKRLRLCVAWGANFNWGELQKRRLAREGDRPVPHYWEHVQWVWGKNSLEEFMTFAPQITLADCIDKITVPFLVTHGSNDRQIPREYAIQQYEGAIHSPKRELKWFTPAEGGVEHVSAGAVIGLRGRNKRARDPGLVLVDRGVERFDGAL